MDIFGSVFASSVTVGYLLLAVGVAIVIGLFFRLDRLFQGQIL